MLNVAIILGSTRPNRNGEAVAHWVLENAQKRDDARYELVDLHDFHLPLLDEPIPPSQGKYTKPHTKKWAAKVASFDAFVFVTAEYNHGIPAALKNAIDFLYAEWNDKVAGFVSYGSASGVRAVEVLRLVMGELQIADVREQVMLSLRDDFQNFSEFTPRDFQVDALNGVLDQVVRWATAFKSMRAPAQRPAAGEEEAPISAS